MGTTRYRLLGDFGIVRDGAAVAGTRLAARKGRRLLKLLVVERGRYVPVDRIVDALWGDEPPPRAAENVASLVSRLRALLGAGAIVGGRGGYRLDPAQAVVDVDEATALVEEAEARLATGHGSLAASAADAALEILDAGPLLADEAEAPWAEEARRHAERLLRRARRVAWQAALDRDAHADALGPAEAAAAADPLDEEAYRALMRAHHGAGEPGAALAAYARLRHVLVEELGAGPGPETEALHLAILREKPLPARAAAGPTRPAGAWGPPGAPAPAAGDRDLVGREGERAVLAAAWRAAAEGRCSLVLVVGEAGIGKTRVALDLAGLAGRTGGLVVSSRCYEAERSLFLQPLVDAVRGAAGVLAPDVLRRAAEGWAGTLAELVPEVGRVLRPLGYERAAPELERRRAFEAVTSFFQRLAWHQPVLLLLDDLHLAGASTLEAVHLMLRRMATERFLALATARAEEADEVVGQLGELAAVVELGPLSEAAVADLAAAMGVPRMAGAVARLTRGHTLYAVEALRSLAEAGPDAVDVRVPESLRAAVLARARRAGPDVEELLRAAAVVGSAFEPDVVAGVLGLDVGDVVRRADRALATRLVVEAGTSYEFANDVLRGVLYDTTPAPTRAARHRRVAAVVTNPEAVAGHAAAGGDWALAVRSWEAAAARAVAAVANREAERLLSQALAAAAHVADPEAEVRIRLARGRARLEVADLDGAADDLTVALELARALGDPRLEAAVLEQRGWVAWFARDAARIDELADRASELAEQAAAGPYARPGGLVLAGRMRHWRGDLAGAEEAVRAALAAGPDPDTAPLARYALGAVLHHADRYEEAQRLLDGVVAAGERQGQLRSLLSALFFAALVRMARGDLAGALHHLERKQALLDRYELSYYRVRTAATLAALWWELGDLGRSAELVGQALELAEATAPPLSATQEHERAHVLMAGAEVALRSGDEGGAASSLALVEPLVGRGLPFESRWGLRLVELHARLDPGRAEELSELARARPHPKYRALALAHLGRREEAAALARALGSDPLLAEVGPGPDADEAVGRMAARLPAGLRDAFVRARTRPGAADGGRRRPVPTPRPTRRRPPRP